MKKIYIEPEWQEPIEWISLGILIMTVFCAAFIW